uniref:Glutathione hydrolase 5 proenzyme n=1 Tax=Ursus maritimus TaxID=29073 RepID=A0A452T266_URSMA
MAQGRRATVSMVLLGLGLALAIVVPAVVLSRRHTSCGPQAFAHAAVAADSKVCSDIGRAILQQHGSPVDAAIAALVCTGVVNPQSMGLGGGVIFTIYNATTGKVEVINARETVPTNYVPGLLDQCEQAQPLGTGAQWIGVPGELRGYAEAHRRHGRLPWAQLFQPTISLLRGDYHVPSILSQFLQSDFLRPSLSKTSLRQRADPAGPGIISGGGSGGPGDAPGGLHPVLTATTCRGRDSQPHPQRAPRVQLLLGVGGQVRGECELVPSPCGDAQVCRGTEVAAVGPPQPPGYPERLPGPAGRGFGPAYPPGEDGSAVAATSTINTPFGAMLYSPRTGILLNNELLDLCWRRPPGSKVTPQPVPGERPPSSMVPSILVNTAQGSKLVIGGAGGELIISAVAQAIINKLWLGFDLSTAIAAPILHVTSKGHVEYEPRFSQEVQKGLQARGHNQTKSPFFLNVVQAVSQDGACVYAAADPRKGGEASGY